MDTMLFLCGTYFALSSGQEHRALRLTPSQIELVERAGEREFLCFFFTSRGTQGKKWQKKSSRSTRELLKSKSLLRAFI